MNKKFAVIAVAAVMLAGCRQDMVSEENLLQLIAYVKTLKPAEPVAAPKK